MKSFSSAFLITLSFILLSGCSRFTKPRTRVETIQVPVQSSAQDSANSLNPGNADGANAVYDYNLQTFGEGKATVLEDINIDSLDLTHDDVWVVAELTKRAAYYDDLASSNPDVYDLIMSENSACGIVREFLQMSKKGNLVNSAAIRCNEIKDTFVLPIEAAPTADEAISTVVAGDFVKEQCTKMVTRAARIKQYAVELSVDCADMNRTMVDTLAKTQSMVSSAAVLYRDLKISDIPAPAAK